MRRALFSLLLLSLTSALPSAVQAAGRKPPDLSFTADPAVVTAGKTVAIRMTSSRPIAGASLKNGKRETYFYSVSTGTWRAFWGVHSQEKPGPHTLTVETHWRDKVIVSSVTFTVAAGTYPVSRIPLTKSMDNLITSGRLSEDSKAVGAYCARPADAEKRWDGYFVRPTTGIISCVYGARRAYGKRPPGPGHSGTDIAAPEGTPITAPAPGRVVLVDRFESFGWTVLLDHGQGVFTYYLHMKEPRATAGTQLSTGDLVGLMGKEGLATGSHLHWTMVVGGEKVDPMEWTERLFE